VEIRFAADGEMLRLRVEDDGRGITEAELTDTRSLGLLGMRERASAGGGSLQIEAVRGGGTALVLELPRAAEPS
jgi:signal transduction histidine kinase